LLAEFSDPLIRMSVANLQLGRIRLTQAPK
jgi:hypothetical protein